jgi:hypothetical protein
MEAEILQLVASAYEACNTQMGTGTVSTVTELGAEIPMNRGLIIGTEISSCSQEFWDVAPYN